jgi:hypothetical protein
MPSDDCEEFCRRKKVGKNDGRKFGRKEGRTEGSFRIDPAVYPTPSAKGNGGFNFFTKMWEDVLGNLGCCD